MTSPSLTTPAHRSYREVIRAEFSRRLGRNPGYSLRAFARDLKILPNHLSEILSGKKGLSPARAKGLGRALGFSRKETDEFVTLVMAESARSRSARVTASTEIQKGRAVGVLRTLDLNTDEWKSVAHWQHLVLLEFLRIHPEQPELTYAAQSLGISLDEAQSTAERLVRAGLVRRTPQKWRVAPELVRSPDGIPSSAVREFHHQVLNKAQIALDTRAIEDRDFSTLVLALTPEKMGEARTRIRTFLTQLHEELAAQDSQPGTEVYAVGVQCFPFTQTQNEGVPHEET